MLKFIHAADIHLDSPLRGLERYEGAPMDAIRGATRQALENIVRLAVEEEVDLVLIAGDLYDGDWKDYNTGLFFIRQMSALRIASIPVCLIAGNHDAESQITRALRLPENTTQLASRKPQTRIFEDIGVAVHGQSFPSRAVHDDLSAAYPEPIAHLFNIGLLHTCASGRPGHDPYAPCTVEGLIAKGYDYWALGHVHRREVLSEDPWIVFSGNTQGRSIRETGAKGVSLVAVEDGRVVSVEHRPVDVLRWSEARVDAAGAESAAEVLDLVEAELTEQLDQSDGLPLAVRLFIGGVSKAHGELMAASERWRNEIRALAADLSDGSVWVEKIELATDAHVGLEELTRQAGPIGGLLDTIAGLDGDEQALQELAGELAELNRKLPAELRQGEDAIDLESPAAIRRFVRAARQLLIPRLMRGGGTDEDR